MSPPASPSRRRRPFVALLIVALVLLAIPVVAYLVFLAAAILIAPDWT